MRIVRRIVTHVAFFCLGALFMLFMQQAQAEEVLIEGHASMLSLQDPKKVDTFDMQISDRQIVTDLKLTCQAGQTKYLLLRTSEKCAFGGRGFIRNPNDGDQKIHRVNYSGHWKTAKDGKTEAKSLTANYLSVGKASADSAQFGGSMLLMPENPGPSAKALKEQVLAGTLDSGDAIEIDDRVDSVELVNFTLPSSGMPSDKGVQWDGTMLWSYQTDSWFIDLTAKTEGKTLRLVGNMPWAEAGDKETYTLTLSVPAGSENDDALFAESGSGDDDLFAEVDGIRGQLMLTPSKYVPVTVEGITEELASDLVIVGMIEGKNVDVAVTRSFAQIVSILSRTFFGA